MLLLLLLLVLGVRVDPVYSYAPATINILATFSPHESNRALSIDAESANFSRGTSVEVSPEDRRVYITWRDIPEGDYEVTVTLLRSTTNVVVGRSSFQVLGRH